MKSKLREVIEFIDKNFCPQKEEWKTIMEKSEEIKSYIFSLLKDRYNVSKEDLVILGSVPRMTYLKNDFDVDIFIRFEEDVELKSVVDFLIDVVDTRYKTRLRYAEHPYIELFAKGITFNIVPSYKTKYPNWLSPMDRSYYHHNYLVENGIQELYREVVRLKVFLKASGVYGAEIYVGGFSGYLTELLILKYHSFEEAILNISGWKPPTIIDLEGYYPTRQAVIEAFGRDIPLIVIDPVDRGRNVAAAVKKRSFSKVISATKHFINKPSIKFFEESPHLSNQGYFLRFDYLVSPDLPILLVYLKHGEKIEDIHYSQLERLSRKIKNVAENEGFKVFKIGVYSDYRSRSLLIFLFSELKRPRYDRIRGPFPFMAAEENFLNKNQGRVKWIGDDGRWYVLREARFLGAEDVVKHIIENKLVKIPDDLYNEYKVFTLNSRFKEVMDDTLLKTWLISFILGDEFWTLL